MRRGRVGVRLNDDLLAFADRISIAGPTSHIAHLDISGAMMAAGGGFILPAEIEADVLGDDEPFAARGLIVAVPQIGRLFANQPRRVVAQEGFDGNETAADDKQVGFDDAMIRSVIHEGQEPIGMHNCNNSHPHGRGDDDPGLIHRGKQRMQSRETDDACDEGAMPRGLGFFLVLDGRHLTEIPRQT